MIFIVFQISANVVVDAYVIQTSPFSSLQAATSSTTANNNNNKKLFRAILKAYSSSTTTTRDPIFVSRNNKNNKQGTCLYATDDNDDDKKGDLAENFDAQGFGGYLAPYVAALLASVLVTGAFIKFVLLDY